MSGFREYINNLNYLAAVDAVVFVIYAAVMIAFFARKRHSKILFLFILSLAVLLGLEITNAYLDGEYFWFARRILLFACFAFFALAAVVYQSDLKSIFSRVANTAKIDLYTEGFGSDDDLRNSTAEMLSAAQNMAKQNIGAIIVIATKKFPSNILDTGTRLNAELSAALLESIFNTKSPLHDGAVVVTGNRILAAGCYLPLTQNINVSKEYGTRHRAAIGISEESDVLAIVVSETTGIISIAKGGEMKRYITMEKLKEEIEDAFGISPAEIAKKTLEKNQKKHWRI
ncbi:MAG TPA: DNA integrity scanning protein DisA nucleotide-binding domain protein [Eubacteriales bacterium]|jgi:diadenylate cyclase|nr:DNA integrity scanning protein DisA nucleotide-binding domain protein [Clostridia bacterium]HRR89332.1 DNA integrity scanning protein DisA nucleotide-binding domain protein [Eubacteriales bacterium]HRU84932.1 DNA integrity scanning protein DisA nucleotide-binding domain protein [Eubacteriales bacterium]